MRYVLIVLSMTFGLMTSVPAQLSVGIGLPGVSIGINVPIFPELVRVPGYPVYYAPGLQSNFFFYDGMYWVYQGDNWYTSSWYNGPWGLVEPEVVPVFVLRIPVRYYRRPPTYFRGWQAAAPPRWGEHWGNAWQEHRRGWDRWDRSSAPRPAPLPVYQRKYSADRYPQAKQQQALRSQNYHYEPRDAIVRQHLQVQAPQQAQPPAQRAPQPPAHAERPSPPPPPRGEPVHRPEPVQAVPSPRAPTPQDQRKQPLPVVAPREQPHPAAAAVAPQPPAAAAQEHRKEAAKPATHEQQPPAARKPSPAPDKAAPPQQKHDPGQGKGHESGEEPSQERKK